MDVLQVTVGDPGKLLGYMNSAAKLEESTKAQEIQHLEEFREMNAHIDEIENFRLLPLGGPILGLLEKIETSFQGKFHFLHNFVSSGSYSTWMRGFSSLTLGSVMGSPSSVVPGPSSSRASPKNQCSSSIRIPTLPSGTTPSSRRPCKSVVSRAIPTNSYTSRFSTWMRTALKL